MPKPPAPRTGPTGPAKPNNMTDRLSALRGRMGGGTSLPIGPTVNRPVSRPPTGGPMNPGPMPLPPQVNVQPETPVQLPPQVNVQPNPAMGGGMGGPQVNVQPNPAMGGGMGPGMKRGGKVRQKAEAKYSSGGSTSKASSRADGIAQRGKTKGRMC